MAPPQQPEGAQRPPRRPWRRPCVASAPLDGPPAVLLCSTAAPYVCEGGGCCDIAPDCKYYCSGG